MRCATGVSATGSASGEILNEEFLKPLGLTANALAKAIGLPPNRISAILKDERGIHRGHGDPAGNVFQNIGGILHQPANDPRPAQCRKGVASEGEKEYRRQQECALMVGKADEERVIMPIISRKMLAGEMTKTS